MSRSLKSLSMASTLRFFASFIAFVAASGPATAAIAPKLIQPGALSSPVRFGVLAGGKAADEFSLLAVQRSSPSHDQERLVLSYGDRFGKPLQGEPGFFHLSLDKASRRLALDLAQVSRTAVDSADLAQILAGSKLIGGSDMTMDPVDGSTNITLNLRTPAAVAVASKSDGQGRIIIEIRSLESDAKAAE